MKKGYIALGTVGAGIAFLAGDYTGFFGEPGMDVLDTLLEMFQERVDVAQTELAGDPIVDAGTTAGAVTEAPEAVTEAPEAVTEAPEAVTEAPEAVTEAPEAVTEAPEATDTTDIGFAGTTIDIPSGSNLDSLITQYYGEDLTYAEHVAIAEKIVTENPEAFKDGNPHFMYGGAELTLPGEASVTDPASAEFIEKYGDASLHPGASSAPETLEPITESINVEKATEPVALTETVVTDTTIPELSNVTIPVDGMEYGDTVIADIYASENGPRLLEGFEIDLRGGLITEVDGETVIEKLNQDGSTQKILLADADPELIRSAEANTTRLQEVAREINSQALSEGGTVTGSRIRQRAIEVTDFEKAVRLLSRDATSQAGEALLERHQPLDKRIALKILGPR